VVIEAQVWQALNAPQTRSESPAATALIARPDADLFEGPDTDFDTGEESDK